MGKSLVINGIDASPANLGQVELVVVGLDITGTLQTKTSTYSGYGAQYFNYNTYHDAFQPLSARANNKIGLIDVSQYVGQTLRARIRRGGKASDFTPAAYWRCFASSISSASIGKTVIQNAVTVVQYVDGIGGDGLHDFYLPIPAGAKYFIFDYHVEDESDYSFIII